MLDDEAQFLQSPGSAEFGSEENPHMFASLFEVLSTFSPSSPSISSSSSSNSSLSVLSPDLNGGAQSSNRSSSEESVPADILFDGDITRSSESFDFDDFRYSQGVDFFSMPGGFSEADSFQPGTSAGTIRPLVNSIISDGVSSHSDDDDWPSSYGEYATPELDESDMFDERVEDVYDAVDGNDQEDRRHRRAQGYGGRRSSDGHSNDGQHQRQTNGGDRLPGNGRQGSGSNGRGGGGGGDDRRKDEPDWRISSTFSTPSDSEDEESEEEGTRQSTHQSQTAPQEVSSSGDDVPLAQSIPTALRAQRTIRKQVRDEKDERRRLRALRRQQQQSQQPDRQQTPTQAFPDEPLRHHTMISSSTQHTSAHPARSRTRTLPSNTTRPVVAEDLARRLRDIQDTSASSSLLPRLQPSSPPESTSHSDRPARRLGEHARMPSASGQGQERTLRPTRSFHRPIARDTAQAQPVPMPPLTPDMYRLGRSATTVSRPTKLQDPFETSLSPPSAHKPSRRPQTSDGAHGPSTPPFNFSVFQRAAAPSTDAPDPSSHPQVISKEVRQISWQQRIFVVDLQRFNTLTINPSTTAKEVIDVLEGQGQLANWAGVGGWMLFEVSQDFGMGEPSSTLMTHFPPC